MQPQFTISLSSQTLAHNLSEWSVLVRYRDGHTCQECGRSDRKVVAHHIVTRKEDPSLTLVIANGRSLCHLCHRKFHKGKMGSRGLIPLRSFNINFPLPLYEQFAAAVVRLNAVGGRETITSLINKALEKDTAEYQRRQASGIPEKW